MLASGLLAGILVGLLFGGRLDRLRTFQLRLWPLLVMGLALRLLVVAIDMSSLLPYVIPMLCTLVVTLVNIRLAGVWLVMVGTAMNLLVVVANSGMPVDPTAQLIAGGNYQPDGFHVPLTRASSLGILADLIPISAVRGVYSVGDLLILVGGFWISFWLLKMRRQGKDDSTMTRDHAVPA
jgi:uncharacterized protein DUF5317